MDGLLWATGRGPTIPIAGRTVLIHGRRLRDYGTIEAEILRRRGNPFDLLRFVARQTNANGAEGRETLIRLFNDVAARWCRVSSAELFDWLDTWPGRACALWLAVRENDRRWPSLESIIRHVVAIDWPRALEGMAIANGEDERATIDLLTSTNAGHAAPIPWSAIYRRLAEHPFHMSIDDIGNLTLRQLRMSLAESDELADRLEFDSAADMNEWRSRRETKFSMAIDNLRRGSRWDAQLES